jgi:ankyrin repeat protein
VLGDKPRLSNAQFHIAREYGFPSWRELKAWVESHGAAAADQEALRKRWLVLVYGRHFDPPRPAAAARLLEQHPELQGVDGATLGMPPLVAVTHSGLLRVPEHADRLRARVRELLARGDDPNQSWENPAFPGHPLSALYGAAGVNRDPELTRVLLEAGANPNDNESLYHSVESRDLACTRLLLKAGARVTGTNALFRVLDFDNLEGLKLLLANGGDANERSGGLNCPIHHALRRRRSLAHVEALLEAGADPTATTRDGVTPYRLALRYGLPEIAARLPGGEQLSLEDQFVAA